MTDAKTSDTNPIYYQDATTLAALIRTKQFSSREVVQAHLDRIEAVNPKINAVVTLDGRRRAEGARTPPTRPSRAVRTGPAARRSVLDQGSLDTAGVLTQRGSKLFAGNIPDKDATAVARFKAAGGIPLMKTNLPEFSAWTETDNLRHRPHQQPLESRAHARRFVRRRVGSDRRRHVADRHRQRRHDLGAGPAAFTGIAALKATHGRIPYTGHYPSVISHWWHVGPWPARSATSRSAIRS